MPDDHRHLEGNFAPIDIECDVPGLPVTGELPRGLNGTLYRNGPNPQFPACDPLRDHWFLGDGMIHACTLRDGHASYRNRWVRTSKFQAERAAGHSLGSGFAGLGASGVANTNIIWHGGRLLALEEAHPPVELDRTTLTTRGACSFEGAPGGPFTAHPKIDPATGELVFFGYAADGPLTPGMSYGTIGPDGRVTRFERFAAPYCAMVHDFAVTERHVLFPVLPLCGSLARLRAGLPPFAWEPELGASVGLVRRDRGVASLRWFRAESRYAFHVLNAWDEGNRIVADVMESEAPAFFPRADGGLSSAEQTSARLTRWTLDPDAGTDAFARARLDDLSGEFPRLDDRRAGLPNRFGSFIARSRAASGLDTLVWLDLRGGRRATHTLPPGDGLSEAIVVPRGPRAAEGDGWLLAIAWRERERRSELVVLDTDGIEQGPVATVRLPHRVPFGFHGNWVDDAC